MPTRASTSGEGPVGSDPVEAAERNVEHVLGIHDTDAFLVATVVEFVHAALQTGAMAVVTLPAAQQPEVRAGLVAAGGDVDEAIARGDLVQVASEQLCRN